MASVRIHYSSAFAFLQFPSSFGVWCYFCPSRVMPSDPDTVCKNGGQVSHRCLSFSPVYRFGDGHASIPDRSFIFVVLATLNDLSYQKRGNVSSLSFSPLSYFLDEYGSFSVRLIIMWLRPSCPTTCLPSASSPPS